jgi:predicted phosphoribosyltransferase
VSLFENRRAAGRALARKLIDYKGKKKLIVLALPRGGVAVSFEIARALHAPLDIILVRKLGVPGHHELAMGAITSGGIRLINHDVVRLFNISQFAIDAVVATAQEEISLLERTYRDGWPALDIHDHVVIVVDDGIATGETMRTALIALKQRNATNIIAAAPTASRDSIKMLSSYANCVVCLSTPEPYISVGRWYEDFTQATDQEIRDLLIQSAKHHYSLYSQGQMH